MTAAGTSRVRTRNVPASTIPAELTVVPVTPMDPRHGLVQREFPGLLPDPGHILVKACCLTATQLRRIDSTAGSRVSPATRMTPIAIAKGIPRSE